MKLMRVQRNREQSECTSIYSNFLDKYKLVPVRNWALSFFNSSLIAARVVWVLCACERAASVRKYMENFARKQV